MTMRTGRIPSGPQPPGTGPVLGEAVARVRNLENAAKTGAGTPTLPNVIVAGTSGVISVPDSTLTAVKFLVESTGDDAGGYFSTTTVSGHITQINILQDGLYMAQGMVVWETPGSYFADAGIVADGGIDFLNHGGLDDPISAVPATYPASLTDPPATQQLFSMLNFIEGAGPYAVTIQAYQTSGSTQEIETAALTIIRIGDNGLGDYD